MSRYIIEVSIEDLITAYLEQQYPQGTKLLDVNYQVFDTTMSLVIEEPVEENKE